MALIRCQECGKEYSDIAEICPSCGYNPTRAKEKEQGLKPLSERKDKTVALLITFFLWGFGGTFFYLGNPLVGFIVLINFVVFFCLIGPLVGFIVGPCAIIHFIIIAMMSEEEFNLTYNLAKKGTDGSQTSPTFHQPIPSSEQRLVHSGTQSAVKTGVFVTQKYYCSHCGNEIPEGMRVDITDCIFCGKPLPKRKMVCYCRECDKKMPEGMREDITNCIFCGKPLTRVASGFEVPVFSASSVPVEYQDTEANFPPMSMTKEEVISVLKTIKEQKYVNFVLLKMLLNSPRKASEMLQYLQRQHFIQPSANEGIYVVNRPRIDEYLNRKNIEVSVSSPSAISSKDTNREPNLPRGISEEDVIKVLTYTTTYHQINFMMLKNILNSSAKASEMLKYLRQQNLVQITENEEWKLNVSKIDQYLASKGYDSSASLDSKTGENVGEADNPPAELEEDNSVLILFGFIIFLAMGIFVVLYIAAQ